MRKPRKLVVFRGLAVVARARNHLRANRSLGFCFEIRI